jgi:sugar/nucleoside kinase (ribokinase family)
MSRSTRPRRLAAAGALALVGLVGLAACGDDEPAEQMEEQMEDTGSDVMTETTEAMMEDDAMTETTEVMTESTDVMTDESMTESTEAMTEATTAP